jgi:hypothetical protein
MRRKTYFHPSTDFFEVEFFMRLPTHAGIEIAIQDINLARLAFSLKDAKNKIDHFIVDHFLVLQTQQI